MEQHSKETKRSGACEEWGELLALYAANELEESEQGRVREHLANCAGCAGEAEAQSRLLAVLNERQVEPEAALLANCRSGLVDALDQEEDGGWLRRTLGWAVPTSWLNPRPAWSAAVLLILGFSVGMLGPRYLATHNGKGPATGVKPSVNVLNSAAISTTSANSFNPSASTVPISDLDLHSADVAGIRVIPGQGDEPAQVELQMSSQEPLEGTVDNDNIKRVLLNILGSGRTSDPDARLDAVDLLSARKNDPDVRSALCHAVHTDPNAAVRLKALEALNGTEPQDLVRQTLLDALVDDHNPGVRVEAINALREMAAKGQVSPDDHMLAVLRERMEKDPNTYIRLQSAAAIRDLGPREKF